MMTAAELDYLATMSNSQLQAKLRDLRAELPGIIEEGDAVAIEDTYETIDDLTNFLKSR